MSKIKLTKGELKRQRDALKRYERYLPILQLKKQQLQMEILRQTALLEQKRSAERERRGNLAVWAGLLTDPGVDIGPAITPRAVIAQTQSVAGITIPVFDRVDIPAAERDLFLTPLWLDAGIEALQMLVSLREEIALIGEGIRILRYELRITTQRVNLFEKVKIPEAMETIRQIKIFLGDQMANAVGRSKIAKRKIEEAMGVEALEAVL